MQTYSRELRVEEIEKLKSGITNINELVKTGIWNWIIVSVITLIPMFILFNVLGKNGRIIYLIADQLLVITFFVKNLKLFDTIKTNIKIKKAIKEGHAEVTRIKANKAIIRPDSNNTSQGYYLDIVNNKTIYLQNEYIERLHFQNKFPNTEFEIVKTFANNRYVDTIILGQPLSVEKEIAPFSKEQYKSGNIHKDGQILETPIENIN